MKLLKFLYHFLGSVYFAVSILVCLILFTTLGTFIESYTESHLFAANLTYHNPLFASLLWMMFVNILFAALRRWPFKQRHIPFLLTHLGLLMILGGCLIKAYFGTQGQMLIVEGSGSDEIMIPGSTVIELQDEQGKVETFPLDKSRQIPKNERLKVVGYYPHHKSQLKIWPIAPGWNVKVLEEEDFKQAVKDELLNNLTVRILDRKQGRVIEEKNVHDSEFSFSYENGSLIVDNQLEIPLSGPLSLMTLNYKDHLRGSPSTLIELSHPKAALVKRNSEEGYQVTTIDQAGGIRTEELSSLVVYDKGFGGIYMQSSIPSSETCREKEFRHKEALKRVLSEASELTFPLEAIRSACTQENFSEAAVGFLTEWDSCNQWIFSLGHALSKENCKLMDRIDWDLIPKDQLKSAYFASLLLQNFDENSLSDAPWKYLLLKDQPKNTYEQSIIEQLFLISSDLPELPDFKDLSSLEKARVMTVLLRAYGIHLKSLIPPEEERENIERLELPVTQEYSPEKPSNKLEENLPLIFVQFENGKIVPAPFDPFGTGLKWPAAGSDCLIHFKPKFEKLPCRLRLRNAREYRYPGSDEPFSYEADIIVYGSDKSDGKEITLSMNHVYETWDGYRFYLASIHSEGEMRARKVQLSVNHDPARYRLTYPGGAVAALGIILLFWRPKFFRH